MKKFSVVLDACVLYPAPLRDLLMRLSVTDLFKARWTDQIHEEWIQALLRKGVHTEEQLTRVKDLMDAHVRDAKIINYEGLIDGLSLPDPDDRHVLAAAIRSNADAIITYNLKDFPKEILEKYSIEAIHPDDFIYYQLDLAPSIVCNVVKHQRKSLNKPTMSRDQFLNCLLKQQLPQSVSGLKKYIEFI
jgi:predicted nucleic acid-binding protein